MAEGTNRRMHNSECAAKKAGYPDAVATPYKDLGYSSTSSAKKEEAKAVRDLRNQGHELPLNKERDKAYRADSDSNESSTSCKKGKKR